MTRDELGDLAVFAAVAEGQSFTRAATQLEMSQSAVSQIVRRLEHRLGVLLLARTTRSVAPTQAGEQLLATLAPMLRELDDRMTALGDVRDKPSGTIRITTVEHATCKFLVPSLAKMLAEYPDIRVEFEVDYGLANIVAAQFDAGVRLGEQVERDMIAVRISPPIPMAIVGSPAYFERFPIPHHPQDLRQQLCLNLRLPTSGSNYEWKLGKHGKSIHVRLDGPLVLNAVKPIEDAALAGIGLANLPLDQVAHHLASGELLHVLADWSEDLPPYHLYYPHRRHQSAAFRLFVEAVRWRD